jgi:hypothetical protein
MESGKLTKRFWWTVSLFALLLIGMVGVGQACSGGFRAIDGGSTSSSQTNPLGLPPVSPSPSPIPIPTPAPSPSGPPNNTTLGTVVSIFPDQDITVHSYLDPMISNTLARSESNRHDGIGQPVEIVSGTAQLDLISTRYYQSAAPTIAGGTLIIKYIVDGVTLPSQITGPPFVTSFDTTQLSDGTHAISAKVLFSSSTSTPAQLFYTQSRPFIVQNLGPLNGAQRIPVTGTYFYGDHMPPAIDWINYSGTPFHNTARPYPHKVVPPSNSATLRNPRSWFVEPIDHAKNTLYKTAPELFTTKKGGVFVGQYNPEISAIDTTTWNGFSTAFSGLIFGHNNFDGGRNDNKVDPYSTFIPAPDGNGWLGINFTGVLFRLTNDGTVTTLFGLPHNRAILPLDFNGPFSFLDFLGQASAVGINVDNQPTNAKYDTLMALAMPTDLTADPRNSQIIYIADAFHHRIAKVDLSASPVQLVNYAGVENTTGYQDGSSSTALFNEPHSLVMAADGTLYVADLMNSAIRAVSPDGSTVTTLAGGSVGGVTIKDATALYNDRAKYYYPTPVAFAGHAVPFPQVIRFDSQGNLIEGDALTRSVRILNLTNKTIQHIYYKDSEASTTPDWVWLDVDRHGNVGPLDDIFFAVTTGIGNNASVLRISHDGSYLGNMNGSGPLPFGQFGADQVGHYPWAVTISDTEAQFLAIGIANDGVSSLRPVQPDDEIPTDILNSHYALWLRGQAIYARGTIPEFPFAARPSFAALWGSIGYGRLLGTFEDVVEKYPDDASLANFIRSGMGGSVARPEITGNNMIALIYYIRRNSVQQGLMSVYNPPATDPGRTAPIISNIQRTTVDLNMVRVDYVTSTPTIGFVAWGTDSNYYQGSEIEAGYGTVHSITVKDLPSGTGTFHFGILVKDQIGNETRSDDAPLN